MSTDPIALAGLDHLPEVLTVEEYARLLRISRRSAYEQIRRGEVPARRFSGSRGLRIARNCVAVRLLTGSWPVSPAGGAGREESGK